MKKILFHLFLLASLFMAACHDDNGGPSSIVIDKDKQFMGQSVKLVRKTGFSGHPGQGMQVILP